MPLPLNQSTNRFSGALLAVARGALVSAAYAVPVELNIETSGGRPTTTGAWAAVEPSRKIRRDSRIALSDDLRHRHTSP